MCLCERETRGEERRNWETWSLECSYLKVEKGEREEKDLRRNWDWFGYLGAQVCIYGSNQINGCQIKIRNSNSIAKESKLNKMSVTEYNKLNINTNKIKITFSI